MAKLILTDITSGYLTQTAYNANNVLIEAALENTVSRDGTSPNAMSADLDLNSKNINNANSINTAALQISGVSVVPGDTLSVPTAANVPNVAAGTIVATDVQSALNELDVEKALLAGDATQAFSTDTLTVLGAFTSLGIDDNATAEMMQINDNTMVLGDGVLDFVIRTVDTDTKLTIRSGSGASVGPGIVMYGPNDPGARDHDLEIISENKVIADWDASAFEWSFFAGAGPLLAITIQSDSDVAFTRTVLTAASVTARAGIRLPHGTAPSSPVDGDMWTTTSGLFVRINGSTIGPLS